MRLPRPSGPRNDGIIPAVSALSAVNEKAKPIYSERGRKEERWPIHPAHYTTGFSLEFPDVIEEGFGRGVEVVDLAAAFQGGAHLVADIALVADLL